MSGYGCIKDLPSRNKAFLSSVDNLIHKGLHSVDQYLSENLVECIAKADGLEFQHRGGVFMLRDKHNIGFIMLS